VRVDLIVIIVVVALAGSVPATLLRSRRLATWIFPELSRAADYRDRKSLISQSMRAIHADAWIILLICLILTLLWLLLGGRSWIASSSLLLCVTVFALVPYLLASAAFWWIFRERLRRALRAELAQRGHALCARCGYDLRGLSADRCPECGWTTSGAQREEPSLRSPDLPE